MDLSSQTWIQHPVNRDHPCYGHTGFWGVNKCVIIIGGRSGFFLHESNDAAFHVRFESKSLQQLAMQKIYEHRTVLPYKYLPSTLLAQLDISQDEEISS